MDTFLFVFVIGVLAIIAVLLTLGGLFIFFEIISDSGKATVIGETMEWHRNGEEEDVFAGTLEPEMATERMKNRFQVISGGCNQKNSSAASLRIVRKEEENVKGKVRKV